MSELPESVPQMPTHETGTPCCDKDELEALLREITLLANRLKQLAGDFQTPGGLPIGGKLVLDVLARHGARTVPQIARIRATSRQNIQVLVNGLEAAGHVELVPNPSHRRSPFIRITDHGRVALGEMLRSEEGLTQTLAPQLGKARVISALDLLGQIRRLLVGGEQRPTAQLLDEDPARRQLMQSTPAFPKRSRNRRPSPTRVETEKSPNEEPSASTDLPFNLL